MNLRLDIVTSRPARAVLAVAIFVSGLAATLPAGASAATSTGTPPPVNWTQHRAPKASPPGRYEASMAFDPVTHSAVLFGGAGVTGALADTWAWTGKKWSQQAPVSSPSARYGAAMAYDAATGTIVLFGGYGPSGSLDDTWTWDGSTWTQQHPLVSPAPRWGAMAAYDVKTASAVLFGGSNALTGIDPSLDDTWTWNGSTWTQQQPTTSPPFRFGGVAAYDNARGTVLLFGGQQNFTAGTELSDTWEWTGRTWVSDQPTSFPPGRVLSVMAYDGATDSAILFGGVNDYPGYDPGYVIFGDTWTVQ